MRERANTEVEVVPELEAIAAAAADRLRAEASGEPHDVAVLDGTVGRAASAAIAARLSLGAIADAERTGQARARQELRSETLGRVGRAAKRKREAEREYEQSVVRADALGLAHGEIAERAGVARGTIRAIVTRSDSEGETTPPPNEVAASNGGEPEAATRG